MTELREAGYIMRIGVMALVLPIWLLATGLFAWNGELLYTGLMIFFGTLMVYGGYMNWKRLASEEKIDDERMQQVNWKSSANAFWAMTNTAIILGVFGSFISEIIPVTEAQIINYDATAILGIGFISYFAFRTYYLRYGLDNEFWRFNKK